MATEQYVHTSVRGRLRALRRSLRARLLGEGLSWVLLALVGVVFVTLGFDYVLRLDRTLRGVIMGLALAAVAWLVWRQIVWPLRVPMDMPALALLVENRFGQVGDRLISAIQFDRAGSVEALGMSAAMVAAMAEEANKIVDGLSFRQIVERRGSRHAARVALAGLMLLAGFTVWQRPIMELWFRRNVAFAQVDWPQDTYLEVLGGEDFPDFKVVRGEDLEIRVAVREGGVIPPYIVVHAEYPVVGRTEERVDLDDAAPVPFTKKFRNVSDEFSFYVTGGDDRLDKRRKHRVFLVDAPALKEVSFTVERPAYMNRPPETLSAGAGMLSLGCGWRIRIEGVATKNLRAARMIVESRLGKKQRELGERLAQTGRLLTAAPRGGDRLAAIADSLTESIRRQEEILAAIGDNPPPGDRCSAERIKREIIVPLTAIAGQVRKLSGKSADEIAQAAEGMARTVEKASLTVNDAIRWMRECPMQTLPLPGDGGEMRGLKGSFYVWGRNRAEPMTLSILMTDTEGITNRRGSQYFLQVGTDNAPTVQVRKRDIGAVVTPQAMIPLAVQIKDDMGIASAGVLCAVVDRKVTDVSETIANLTPGKAEFRTVHVLDLLEHKEMALVPGDLIQVTVRAVDTMPGDLGGPNIGTSGRLDFRVVRPEDLLDELIRRQKELRIEFAQAIALQVSALGKTLDANDAMYRDPEITAKVRLLLGDSGSIQTSVGAECAKAGDTISAIMAEMQNNRLGNKQDIDETDVNVIRPLGVLAEDIRGTVALLARAAEFNDADALSEMAGKIAILQANHQAAMEAILDNMEKIGSRQEVDKELQRIIRLSKKLLEEIEDLADEQTEDTFDPKKPKQD